jgi:hypothetical protein
MKGSPTLRGVLTRLRVWFNSPHTHKIKNKTILKIRTYEKL